MLILLVIVIVFHSSCLAQNLLVDLEDGKVQGVALNTTSGRSMYTWRHIPYAKPPIENLRFMSPENPDKWSGVLDGSRDSFACHFVGSFPGDPEPTHGYSEDCLYINVYSPVKPNANLGLPVMFWIYGGGYMAGTSDCSFYDPTPLLEEDVIVVTFNYRLGIFGFLSTGDNVVAGNAALKDQQAALKWTKNNIAAFGGNPDHITIFGESAGAFSVGYHLVSPKSKAILQSGTSLFSFLQPNPKNNALAVAAQLNSSISDKSSSTDILLALQAIDENHLVNITWTDEIDLLRRPMFTPVLEVENPTSFLTEPFYESIEAGNFNRVPIIIGMNSEEQIVAVEDYAAAQKLAAKYDANETLLLPAITLRDSVDEGVVTSEIKRFYTGNGSFADNIGTILELLSDTSFRRPVIKHALLQSSFTPVYLYQFAFVGTPSKSRPEISGCGRVGHADEIPYIFNFSTKPLETDEDFTMRKKFVKLWTNFAKTKNPTPANDDSGLLGDITWSQFEPAKLNYLNIDGVLEVRNHLRGTQTAFWDYLWNSYSVRPFVTF